MAALAKGRLALLCAAFAVAASPSMAYAADKSEAQSCSAVQGSVPAGRLNSLARGFNLTGWFGEDENQAPDFAVLAELHRRGFSHVRLPIAPERFLEEFAAPEDIPASLAALDAAIAKLTAIGFSVSLDIHPGDKLNKLETDDPERAAVLLGAVWQRLASRYAKVSPDQLFFEVLNEPAFSSDDWAMHGPLLADTIRRAAPDHTIIYALSGNQRADELGFQPPLAMPDVVYAVHFYDPMVFTHQGMNWSDDPLGYLHGVPFPLTPSDPSVQALLRELQRDHHAEAASILTDEAGKGWNEDHIKAELSQAEDWSRAHQTPIVINEFGVLAWKAPRQDRIAWLKLVSGTATADCMGWALWDYAQGFGFVERVGDKEIPDEALLAALLGRRGAAKDAGDAPRKTRTGSG